VARGPRRWGRRRRSGRGAVEPEAPGGEGHPVEGRNFSKLLSGRTSTARRGRRRRLPPRVRAAGEEWLAVRIEDREQGAPHTRPRPGQRRRAGRRRQDRVGECRECRALGRGEEDGALGRAANASGERGGRGEGTGDAEELSPRAERTITRGTLREVRGPVTGGLRRPRGSLEHSPGWEDGNSSPDSRRRAGSLGVAGATWLRERTPRRIAAAISTCPSSGTCWATARWSS